MRRTWAGRLNWVLLISAGLLCVVGMLALGSFSPPDRADPRFPQNVFVRQASFLLIGLVVLVATIVPNYLHWRRAAWLFYAACLAALVALLILNRQTKGARGWFHLGPLMLQPAEFAKIAVVLLLARHMMYQKSLNRWRGLVAPLAIVGVPTGLIFVQPDFGSAFLFGPIFLTMLWAAGAPTKRVAVLLLLAATALPLGFRFGLQDYQRDRLLSFVYPEKVSKDQRHQQEESVKACGAGGIAGRNDEAGGAYAFHIPHRQTDFVFSIVAEELGFLGSTFVLLLFALFLLQSLLTAHRSREPFGRLVVVGLTTYLAFQVYVNVGMTIGVAPITGLTLPLISYGGSSLLSTFVAIGLILNVGSRWRPSFSSRELSDPVEMTTFRPHESLQGVL